MYFENNKGFALVFYIDVVREKSIDADYELWVESSVSCKTVYVHLRMMEDTYKKQKDKLKKYFTGGINYADMKKRVIPTLKKGTWSYYVYGYDNETIEVASKVKDLSVELKKIDDFHGDLIEVAGLRFRPNGDQQDIKQAYHYLNNIINTLGKNSQ
jgi:hypothetical protein